MSLFLPAHLKKVRSPFFLFILLVSLSVAGCGDATSTPTPHPTITPSATASSLSTTLPDARYASTIQKNVAYGPLAAETLDLCQPTGASGARPGVILIHGGSWITGDASNFDPICQALAARGFVAATINYRLAQASDANTLWPAQIVDTQLAVRWLRSQATHLHLDPQRLCSWGSSAGGHLAVFVGTLKTIHSGDQAQLLADQSPAVSCVVDDFGPVDLTKVPPQFTLAFLGTSYAQNPALYRDASPIFLVTSQSAPTLIVQGTGDTTVPPNQSIELQQALQQHGVPVQYISYDGEHGFKGLTEQQLNAILAQEVNYLVAQEKP